MSVESVVINLAFCFAFGLLIKPLGTLLISSLMLHSQKISSEILSIDAELEEAKKSLALAIDRNSSLETEVEVILSDAKSRAVRISQSGKLKVEAEFAVATDKARSRIISENRDLMLKVKLSLLESTFESLCGFGGKSLKKAEHDALISHMAHLLSTTPFSE